MWKDVCPECGAKHIDENSFCSECMHTLMTDIPHSIQDGWTFREM